MQRDHSVEIEAAFAAHEAKRAGRVVLSPPRFESGPYLSPLVRIGDEVLCAHYGQVVVVGWSEGPLLWPLCHISGPRSLILFADLERAVMVESAQSVAIAWGVSRVSVHKWRQTLEVERVNAGTTARWARNLPDVISEAQLESGAQLAHAHETRVKSEATKRRNGTTRQQWTPQQIAQMGVLSDAVIAQSAGCEARTVERERRRRGIICQGAGGKGQGEQLLDGARVQARRWELKLTQSQVGARFGCGHCRISHLENGRKPVTQETVDKLAHALNCPPETLLAREV